MNGLSNLRHLNWTDFPSMDLGSSSGVSGYYGPTQVQWCDVSSIRLTCDIAQLQYS